MTPSESQPTRPRGGDRVRHRTTGDDGELVRIIRPNAWADWALVRWDDDGPGMVGDDGLSRVAPGLLDRVGPA